MGRTHTWTYRRAFTDQEWVRLLAEAKRIVAQAGHSPCVQEPLLRRGEPILLAGPRGTLWPLFEHQVIALNGKRPDHYGSFVLFKRPAERAVDARANRMAIGICETAGRPYEAIIVFVLAAACAIAPGAIEVCSKDDDLADQRESIR